MFQEFGLECDFCFNGQEAVDRVIKRYHEACQFCQTRFYDLILMDIDMPVKNGYNSTQDILNFF
jgi:CheY-like chemotaxis protein